MNIRPRHLIFLALLCVGGVALWFGFGSPYSAPAPTRTRQLIETTRSAQDPTPAPSTTTSSITYNSAMLRGANARLITPGERATDFRSVFEHYRHSDQPLERHLAYRLWSACFPRFLAGYGALMTAEAATRGFSDAPNSENRTEAVTVLFAKCKPFLALPREEIVATSLEINAHLTNGLGLSPGEAAAKALLETGTEPALAIASQAVKSGDAYAIASLQDFIHTHLSKLIDGGQLPRTARSDLEALAFTLAACDAGLDCAPESLSATLLCANTAQCKGRYDERLLAQLPRDADRTQALAAKARVLGALKSNDFDALLFHTR